MGGHFLTVNFQEDGSGAGGYAKEMSDEYVSHLLSWKHVPLPLPAHALDLPSALPPHVKTEFKPADYLCLF